MGVLDVVLALFTTAIAYQREMAVKLIRITI
jgi:hypothetical protein